MITILTSRDESNIQKILSDITKKKSYLVKEGALYKFVLERVERPLIEDTLKMTHGNQFKASKILGINRNTLRTKIKKLRINVSMWKG